MLMYYGEDKLHDVLGECSRLTREETRKNPASVQKNEFLLVLNLGKSHFIPSKYRMYLV